VVCSNPVAAPVGCYAMLKLAIFTWWQMLIIKSLVSVTWCNSHFGALESCSCQLITIARTNRKMHNLVQKLSAFVKKMATN